MNTSPDGGEASIESRRDCTADDKAAFVVIVAPGNREIEIEAIKRCLVEPLNKEGIQPAMINDSTMSKAQKSLENEIEKEKVENLIIVVAAGGFYHDDGEAIIFEDCFVLLDTFIHPLIALPENKRPCKLRLIFTY